MTSINDTVAAYLDAWNIRDDDERRTALSVLATSDVRYVDPLAELTGIDQLNGFIGQAQQQFAGLTFRPGAAVDTHHRVARFGWKLAPDTIAEAPVVGFDVIETDDDGRITRVTGFLDRVPG